MANQLTDLRRQLRSIEAQLESLERVVPHNAGLLRDYLTQQVRRRQLTADLVRAYDARLARLNERLRRAEAVGVYADPVCPACGHPLILEGECGECR